MTTTLKRLAMAGAALSMALVLAGCSPAGDSTDTNAASNPSETAPDDSTTDSPKEPVQQAASCEWDVPQQPAGAVVAPESTAGDLATVLVGSWQHTHFDDGNGFEAVDEDIRYVFPSTEQLIYCQHVPGATEHAENKAAITLDGATILPPSPHKGFEVLAWSANTMLWQNNYIDSTYLLVRR